MKIALYSPYVPKHLGGGEKHFFDVARVLADAGHEVYVAVNTVEGQLSEEEIRQKYAQFLQCSLDKVQFIITPLGTSSSFLQKLIWTKQFDVLYYVTDGSEFFSLAKRNMLHIQFPMILDKSSWLEKAKLAQWQIKNTNSCFTKDIIEKYWNVEVQEVLHPMLDPACFQKVGQKEKVILNVGRFFQQLHSKRQDILVEIFKEMVDTHAAEMAGWQLVLVGNVEDEEYAARVRQIAEGYPIQVLHTVTRQELLDWYRRSALYWHATGYGINQELEPEKTEHFGISTAEAMAAGCVPVVVGKGGQPEVLGNDLKEMLWETKEEAIEKTLHLINVPAKRSELQGCAQAQAGEFSEEKFRTTLLKMIAL
jgi:glycosyltransferase involved in cell wall biosynthesis